MGGDEVTRRVWAAAVWVAQVKGWHIEGGQDEDDDDDGLGVVARLEENWRRFMKIETEMHE